MIDIRHAEQKHIDEVVANAKEYYSSEKDLKLRLGHAVTKGYVAIDELGRIGMMFGFYQVWDGVVELWAVTTTNFDYHKIAYTRIIKAKLNEGMALSDVHRMQVYIKAKYPGLIKWAEVLGFTREGLHPKMGSDQEDYYSYGRIK